MSDIDPNKLKVAELREELKSRGLETKGTKAVLVKRLQQALNKEKGIADGDESFVDLDASQEEEHLDESSQDGVQLDDSSQDVTEDAVAEKEPKEYDVGGGDTEGEDADPEQIEGDEYLEGGPEGEEFQTIDETSQDEEGTEDARDDRKEDKGQKRKRSRSRDRRRSRSRDRSRRSRSRSRDRRRSPFKKVEMEDDSWAQSTEYWLDRYNCDLTLRVDDSGYKGHPLSAEGFGFMWSGVRATYGVNKGKVAFEVKILEELSVDHLPEEEVNRHVVRVGWSTDDTSLQLGEEEFSYGYGGTGKASTEINFKDYGEKFGSGDVITAYLDYDSETPTISFSKNGEDLGTCFEIERSTLDGVSLFPHVLTKNTEFECNFGQNAEPWFALKEEFDFAGKIPLEERQRASTPPEKKEECEIIMVVGLPGAGKTVWAGKHAAENPEKKYNILGTNNIIDKMKVMGLPRKRNYAGRWDVLIDKSTKCLNRMIEIAARKKRNYILDQTNVYASARRRKMTPFEGFQRKAVVVIPTDEEFKSRIAQREKEEGKDVPEKAVLEMKANFVLPEDGQLFDSVEFIEMKREEAEKLVDKYRKEAQALLPPPEKRFRGDRFGSRGRFDRRDFRSGRGGYDRERFGGRGGSRGGYRDSRRPPPRHYDRRGGYGGGYGGGNRGGGYFPRGSRSPSNRYNDRNKNFWDKRSSSNYRQPVPRQSFTNQRSGGGSGYGSGQWNRHGNYYGSNNQGSSWGHQGNWNHGHWGSGSSSSPPGYGNWNYGHSGHQGGQGYGGSQWGQNWNQNYWPSYSQNQNYSQWGSFKNRSGGPGGRKY